MYKVRILILRETVQHPLNSSPLRNIDILVQNSKIKKIYSSGCFSQEDSRKFRATPANTAIYILHAWILEIRASLRSFKVSSNRRASCLPARLFREIIIQLCRMRICARIKKRNSRGPSRLQRNRVVRPSVKLRPGCKSTPARRATETLYPPADEKSARSPRSLKAASAFWSDRANFDDFSPRSVAGGRKRWHATAFFRSDSQFTANEND